MYRIGRTYVPRFLSQYTPTQWDIAVDIIWLAYVSQFLSQYLLTERELASDGA